MSPATRGNGRPSAGRPLPHVLIVTPRYLPSIGGVERHVHEIARRLPGLGFETTVLTTDVTGRLPAHESGEGFEIRRVRAWPSQSDYHFAPALPREVARSDGDLVHVQSYHTFVAPLAMLAASRARIPYVVTFHGGGHSSRLRHTLRRPQLAALRPLLARAARLVAIAPFEIELYGGRLRLPPSRFALIPNGADMALPAEDEVTAAEGVLITSVGRLERYKGHQHAIAALPHVLREEPEARLAIIGSGPYEPALRRLARKVGVADRVEIRAVPADDGAGLARRVLNSSLVVLLSEFETHPIAALEALALGRRLLVADTTGLKDLAAHWDGVHKVPLASRPEQVALAMLAALRMPAAGRRPELPTWDDCAAALAGVYRDVLDARTCAS